MAGLEEAARNLNSVSDSFTREIQKIEAYLKKLNFGIEAYIKLGNKENTYLGYGKLSGKWGLLIRVDGEYGNICPILEAPRVDRLAAVSYITTLFNRLTERANDMAKDLQAKIVEMSKFTFHLEKF